MRILLATGNPHKRAELARLLAPLDVGVAVPADVGGIPEVDEDQPTFASNARKKAVSAARASGLWALADDSGLEVDRLAGAPGVRSARYAGEPSDDARNNAKLLAELAGVGPTERGASFVCAVALATPGGDVVAEVQGRARGRILDEPRGRSGFGYDPLFLFDELGQEGHGRTFAQLEPAEKARVSHRARALAALVERLPEILAAPRAPR